MHSMLSMSRKALNGYDYTTKIKGISNTQTFLSSLTFHMQVSLLCKFDIGLMIPTNILLTF